jgi:hypothetical protein
MRLRFSKRSAKTEAPDFLVCLMFFSEFSEAETFLFVLFFGWLPKKRKYKGHGSFLWCLQKKKNKKVKQHFYD